VPAGVGMALASVGCAPDSTWTSVDVGVGVYGFKSIEWAAGDGVGVVLVSVLAEH
jgi:hypothetical protein